LRADQQIAANHALRPKRGPHRGQAFAANRKAGYVVERSLTETTIRGEEYGEKTAQQGF